MLGHRSKISADNNAHAGVGQLFIHSRESIEIRLGRIHRQNRLVDLNPIHTLGGQFAQQLRISGQELRQQGCHAAAEFFFLFTQPQKGERAHQRGLDIVAQRARFFDLGNQIGRMRGKFGVGMPFGHDIVIVGVKPFGHFHRKLRGIAARQLEIFGQAQIGRIKTEALGNAAQRHLRVEHLVVKRKIAHRQQIGTGRFLRRPVQTADFSRHRLQLSLAFRAFPKSLYGKFQLALRADAGIAAQMECVHMGFLLGITVGYKGINLSMLLY